MPSGNFVKAMVILGLLTPPTAAVAIDNGQYSHVPQEIRDWFKSVRSKNGVACCDISDGHRTDYQMRETEYWVPIDGDWLPVPKDAVIHNAANPVGDAVVWYVKYQNRAYIRCFVPGNGV